MAESIIEHIGTFGSWSVDSEFESKTMFPKALKRNPETGEKEEKSVMVRRLKRSLFLKHQAGGTVVISTYMHAGQQRYKDHREEKISHVTDAVVIREMTRMLGIKDDEARDMLRLTT